jgi:hypothetical protein
MSWSFLGDRPFKKLDTSYSEPNYGVCQMTSLIMLTPIGLKRMRDMPRRMHELSGGRSTKSE